MASEMQEIEWKLYADLSNALWDFRWAVRALGRPALDLRTQRLYDQAQALMQALHSCYPPPGIPVPKKPRRRKRPTLKDTDLRQLLGYDTPESQEE